MSFHLKIIGWSAAGLWSSQLISLAAVMILGRMLGPTAYGVAGYVGIFLSFSQILFTDGLSVAVLIGRDDESIPHIVFWLQICLGAMISLAYFAYSIFPVFGAPTREGAVLLRIASIVPLLQAACSVHVDLMRRDMLFHRLAIRGVVSSVASLAVGVTLAVLHFGAATIVFMLVAQWLCTCVAVWFSHTWRPAISPRRFMNTRALSSTIQFGSNAVLARMMSFAESQTPRIAFVAFYSAATFGCFNAAFRIMEVLIIITLYPVSGVASAVFAKHRGDCRALEGDVQKLLGLSSVVTLPAMCGLGVLAKDVIIVMFGNKWLPATDYAEAVSIFGAVLPIVCIFSEYILIVRGARVRALVYAASICAALVTACAARFVPPAEYAVLVAAQSVIIAPIMIMASGIKRNMSKILQSYAIPLVCACAMGLAVKEVGAIFLSGLSPISRGSILVVLGVAVYFGVGVAVFPGFYGPVVLGLLENVKKRFSVTAR